MEIIVDLTIMLLRFAWFLNELRNAMLLQESEKVNISRDVEQKLRVPIQVPKSETNVTFWLGTSERF